MSTIDLDSLKREPIDKKLILLKTLKNDLIGCHDMKALYFNKGIIEVFIPLIGIETDEKILVDILTIINCYFYDF